MILPFIFILLSAVCAGRFAHSWLLGLAVYLGLCAIVGTIATLAKRHRKP
jgi:hypothetical protein